MSFREREIWVSLTLHLGVLALCGMGVFGALRSGATDWIVLANLPIIAFVLTSIFSRRMVEAIVRRVPATDPQLPPDERDLAIEARATALAYRVVLVGMFLLGSLTLSLLSETTPIGPYGQSAEARDTARSLAVVGLNLAFFSFVAAEMTRWITQIVLYRRLR